VSAWRREALARFPERRRAILEALSLYELLGALEYDLCATYRGERIEPTLAEQVFAFAAWCFDARRNWDLRNAVAVGFYEHVPNTPAGRRDIAERLSFDVLTELQPLFLSMLSPSAYEALMTEIVRVHGQRL
jgi:hypothetical protein